MKFVEEISRHCSLTEASRSGIINALRTFTIRKNQHLLEYGQQCRFLYFVESGLLRGYYVTDDKEITNWMAAENELAVSYYSFITGDTTYESIQALEDSDVSALSLKDLR